MNNSYRKKWCPYGCGKKVHPIWIMTGYKTPVSPGAAYICDKCENTWESIHHIRETEIEQDNEVNKYDTRKKIGGSGTWQRNIAHQTKKAKAKLE